MELSPSWEAANCAATQELLSILWNPKVHNRVYKIPPLVPILKQIDPVHTNLSCLSKIHFNIVHPSKSWFSQWSLSFWLSHQYPVCIKRSLAPSSVMIKVVVFYFSYLTCFGRIDHLQKDINNNFYHHTGRCYKSFILLLVWRARMSQINICIPLLPPFVLHDLLISSTLTWSF
jgi:hypothetical protein